MRTQVAALAGDRDIKMTLRYAHLAPSHLHAGIQALEQRGPRHPVGATLSTERRVTPTMSRGVALLSSISSVLCKFVLRPSQKYSILST